MTALQVIEEIEKLPNEERVKVIEFARQSVKRKGLSPEELRRIGERMLAAKDPVEAERLRKELVEGFYDQ